ncbi:hypothetical protein ACH5BF_02165 [Arcobacter sp. YIC-464]|uniref:hypothetical protein n=1 Tax=Arcobacter sp. YIC-464 TaxID=3376631 RepID=UPI003C22398C
MIKKLIMIVLINSFLFAGTHTVNVHKKRDIVNSLFEAKVLNITKFSDYYRVRVHSKEFRRVTLKLSKRELGYTKENDKVHIKCRKKQFGALVNCIVY